MQRRLFEVAGGAPGRKLWQRKTPCDQLLVARGAKRVRSKTKGYFGCSFSTAELMQ